MRRLLMAAVLGMLVTGRADAGLILASGDANITAALTGNEVATDPGNQRFFRNLLGGGSRVLVAADASGQFATLAGYANSFYNSIAGVSSTLTSSPITAANLAGIDLFLSGARRATYSASEIAALLEFSQAGGTILVEGDGTNFESINATADGLLLGLGSGLSIVTAGLDSGYRTATGDHIIADPLTAGVSSFTYAYTSVVVSGGSKLFTTENGSTFVATNVAPAVATPEPGTLASAASGLVALGFYGYRRSRRVAG